MSLLLHWNLADNLKTENTALTFCQGRFVPNLSALLRPGLVALGVRRLVTHSLGVTGLGRHLGIHHIHQPPETNCHNNVT